MWRREIKTPDQKNSMAVPGFQIRLSNEISATTHRFSAIK
jgi:hypothetical protein